MVVVQDQLQEESSSSKFQIEDNSSSDAEQDDENSNSNTSVLRTNVLSLVQSPQTKQTKQNNQRVVNLGGGISRAGSKLTSWSRSPAGSSYKQRPTSQARSAFSSRKSIGIASNEDANKDCHEDERSGVSEDEESSQSDDGCDEE